MYCFVVTMVTVPDSWEKPVKYATLNTKLFIVGIAKSIFYKFKENEQSSFKNFLEK